MFWWCYWWKDERISLLLCSRLKYLTAGCLSSWTTDGVAKKGGEGRGREYQSQFFYLMGFMKDCISEGWQSQGKWMSERSSHKGHERNIGVPSHFCLQNTIHQECAIYGNIYIYIYLA